MNLLHSNNRYQIINNIMNKTINIEMNHKSLVYFCEKCDNLYSYPEYLAHAHISNTLENQNNINKLDKDNNDKSNMIAKADIITDNNIPSNDNISVNDDKINKSCKIKKAKNDQNVLKIDDDIHLTPIQKDVLAKSMKKARIYNNNLYGNVLMRFIELGFSEIDIKKTVEHIKNIKVISHFGRSGDNLNWLINDTQLRNIFEVHNRLVHERVTWEDNLFFKLYKSDCPYSERVKYGCLNLFNQHQGCISAHGYGKSYMIFKDSLKDRTTFVCDLDKKRSHLCTFQHCVQSLLYIKNETLINLVNFVNGKDIPNIENINYVPIEVQVHGDIIFKRDIEKIVFHPTSINDNIRRHLESVGIPYIIQNL